MIEFDIHKRTITLEKYDGNLLTWLKNHKGAGIDLKFCIIKQIMEGLINMHDQGIIHGDIKHENILVNNNCTTCICDFGLSGNKHNVLLKYSPPIYSINDVKAGKSADIYALGIVILEMMLNKTFQRRPPKKLLSYLINNLNLTCRDVLRNMICGTLGMRPSIRSAYTSLFSSFYLKIPRTCIIPDTPIQILPIIHAYKGIKNVSGFIKNNKDINACLIILSSLSIDKPVKDIHKYVNSLTELLSDRDFVYYVTTRCRHQ
jgi:serine/threonine protein kinase